MSAGFLAAPPRGGGVLNNSKGNTGGIRDDELRMILDRKMVCGNDIPRKGRGYEIVEHKASSLVGKVDHTDGGAAAANE